MKGEGQPVIFYAGECMQSIVRIKLTGGTDGHLRSITDELSINLFVMIEQSDRRRGCLFFAPHPHLSQIQGGGCLNNQTEIFGMPFDCRDLGQINIPEWFSRRWRPEWLPLCAVLRTF